jgi:hypothetical protein
MDRIWRRRIDMEKQYRTERDVLLAPLREKYALMRDALMQECEDSEASHDWQFTHVSVDDGLNYRCSFCAKTKVANHKPEQE